MQNTLFPSRFPQKLQNLSFFFFIATFHHFFLKITCKKELVAEPGSKRFVNFL